MSAFFLAPESWLKVWRILNADRLGRHWSSSNRVCTAGTAPPLASEDQAVLLLAMRRAGDILRPRNGGYTSDEEPAAAVFLLLWDANRAAVAGRYREPLDAACGFGAEDGLRSILAMPGAGQPLSFRVHRGTLVHAVKSLQCLHYQCNEDPHPDGRDAHRVGLLLLDRIVNALCQDFVGTDEAYSAADWG